jgi:hypothetical protein
MNSLLARVRFAILWLVAGSALAGTMAVFFYEPGVLEEGVAGEMEGDPVTMSGALMMAVMVALPLAMAAVTLFLPARASAVTNLVVGVPLGAFGLFAIVTHLAAGALPAHLTLSALATAIAWLIVGLSIAGLRRLSPGDAESASARIGSAAPGA